MTAYFKKRFYEYREGKHQAPTFNSFYDMSTNKISGPMENSFLHINGTAPGIVERSKTIVTLRNQPLEDEPVVATSMASTALGMDAGMEKVEQLRARQELTESILSSSSAR